jgi:hypothetical protein
VLARYVPPTSDSPIELDVRSAEALDEVLAAAAHDGSERGAPALELTSGEGPTLVIAQVLQGAVLLWTDALGDSFHSVGSDSSVENTVVFDYFGSYTEVPAEFVVPLDLGLAAVRAFLAGDHPAAAGLALEPD